MGKKIRTKKEKALIASGVSLGVIGLLIGGALVALKCISKSLEGFTIEDDEMDFDDNYPMSMYLLLKQHEGNAFVLFFFSHIINIFLSCLFHKR